MVTLCPSCFPTSMMVVTGDDIAFNVFFVAPASCPRRCGRDALPITAGTAALQSFQLSECFGHFFYWIDLLVAFDFQQQRWSVRRRPKQLHRLFPVDLSAAGPQVRVAVFGVVVNMSGMNVIPNCLECL